ncbi:hypothetical protein RZS08_43165, partial [Arthrospira platensis SPKY1]|nr:hypothetical protein [Arthrospira platensis SPKY1]
MIESDHSGIKAYTLQAMKSWRVYHFHDTGESARVKQLHGINDQLYLANDGRNLAAFLFRLRQQFPAHYQRIVKTIRLIAPFFHDFVLRPHTDNPHQIE